MATRPEREVQEKKGNAKKRKKKTQEEYQIGKRERRKKYVIGQF